MSLHLRRDAFRAAWSHLSAEVTVGPASAGTVRSEQFVLLRPIVASVERGDNAETRLRLALAS